MLGLFDKIKRNQSVLNKNIETYLEDENFVIKRSQLNSAIRNAEEITYLLKEEFNRMVNNYKEE